MEFGGIPREDWWVRLYQGNTRALFVRRSRGIARIARCGYWSEIVPPPYPPPSARAVGVLQDPLLQRLAEDYVDDADLTVRLDRLFEAR